MEEHRQSTARQAVIWFLFAVALTLGVGGIKTWQSANRHNAVSRESALMLGQSEPSSDHTESVVMWIAGTLVLVLGVTLAQPKGDADAAESGSLHGV